MITTLSGKNSFELRRALRAIVEAAESELGDFGVEKIDAENAEVDFILQSVQSLPFLVPKKLVVVNNVQSNAKLLERLEELVGRAADEVDVVLVGPIFDKRKGSYNFLKKHTSLQEFNELKTYDLPKWAVQTAKEKGVFLSLTDATYMIERVGANQMVLESEIAKMSIGHDQIDRAVINKHTEASPQSTVFEMIDAAFSGNTQKALSLYRDQRAQRVDPHYIVAMLSWQLYNLSLAVFADPKTEATLTSAGQSPFTARKSLQLANRTSKQQIRKLVRELTDLDVNLKTNADADSAVELYLIALNA